MANPSIEDRALVAVSDEHLRSVVRLVIPRGTREEQMMMMQLAKVYRLDPLLKHLSLIPNQGIYPTVAGVRHHAESQDLTGIRFRPPTAEERAAYGMAADDKAALWACEVSRARFPLPVVEYGICEASERMGGSRANRNAMARTRALGRALRAAFSLAMTTAEEVDDGAPVDTTPRVQAELVPEQPVVEDPPRSKADDLRQRVKEALDAFPVPGEAAAMVKRRLGLADGVRLLAMTREQDLLDVLAEIEKMREPSRDDSVTTEGDRSGQ